MTIPTHLRALEGVLKDIRGESHNPVTKIWWDMHLEINLELANENSSEGNVILDVGCGGGDYIIALSKNNRMCFGIDPLYEVSLLKARQKAKDENCNIPLIQSVSEDLPFKDEKFDMILHFSTLQHVDDQHKTLSEIKRVLKDNGLLVVSVPLNKNIFTLFRKIKNQEYVTKVFDIRELKKVLTENGFEILKIRGCGFFPPFAHRILLFCYRLFGEKITRKLIEVLDIFARRIPTTASSVVTVCKINKKD
jgi:ubiquinone/menaquinone biosynthesis C-methylase UbiE